MDTVTSDCTPDSVTNTTHTSTSAHKITDTITNASYTSTDTPSQQCAHSCTN